MTPQVSGFEHRFQQPAHRAPELFDFLGDLRAGRPGQTGQGAAVSVTAIKVCELLLDGAVDPALDFVLQGFENKDRFRALEDLVSLFIGGEARELFRQELSLRFIVHALHLIGNCFKLFHFVVENAELVGVLQLRLPVRLFEEPGDNALRRPGQGTLGSCLLPVSTLLVADLVTDRGRDRRGCMEDATDVVDSLRRNLLLCRRCFESLELLFLEPGEDFLERL